MTKLNKIKRINIDKVHYIGGLDTETIGQLNIEESCLPFEIGIMVLDLWKMKDLIKEYESKGIEITPQIIKEIRGKSIVYKKSFIVRKFINNKFIMLSSFSATKYPKYKELIKDTKLYFVGSVKEIMAQIQSIFERFDIKIVMAHNGNFDINAIARLCDEFACFNPFEKKDLLDTMEFATIFTNGKRYVIFCKKNKGILNKMGESAFITNSGRVRLTAQANTCFINDNPEYQESHTALSDILDEIEIFIYSYLQMGNKLVKLNTSPSWQHYEN